MLSYLYGMSYCIKTPEKKQLKAFICKYIKDIPVKNNNLTGTFSVTNIRFYSYVVEVELTYKGKFYGRMNKCKSHWLGPEILDIPNVAKIRVFRFIKKNLAKTLESRLRIFDVDLRDYSYIKKIKWI